MAQDDDDDKRRQLSPEAITAIARAVMDGPMRLPPSDLASGFDAGALRRAIAIIIDDELSRRNVLSERDVRSIAKDVATTVVNEVIGPIRDQIRSFVPDDEIKTSIERVVVDTLRRVGIRADDEHIDDTRQTIDGVMRGHKRRNDIGTDIIKETLKALVTLAVGGALTLASYLGIKGVGH